LPIISPLMLLLLIIIITIMIIIISRCAAVQLESPASHFPVQKTVRAYSVTTSDQR